MCGDPEGGVLRLRCLRAWGGAPFPKALRTEDTPLEKYASRTRALLQPTADHTPSRRSRSCSLAASIVLSRAPLLTRLPLAQPLLSTADPAGNSNLSSPLGVTVADSQPCSGMRGVSKDRVRLAPGSIPARADPCGDFNIGMASKALQVRHSYATSADCTPCRSEHVTDRGRLSRDPVMLLPVVAFACAMQVTSHSLHWRSRSSSKEQISSPWFWRGLHFLL